MNIARVLTFIALLTILPACGSKSKHPQASDDPNYNAKCPARARAHTLDGTDLELAGGNAVFLGVNEKDFRKSLEMIREPLAICLNRQISMRFDEHFQILLQWDINENKSAVNIRNLKFGTGQQDLFKCIKAEIAGATWVEPLKGQFARVTVPIGICHAI